MTAMMTSCDAKSATQCSADITCDFDGSCSIDGAYLLIWLSNACPTSMTLIVEKLVAEGITQAQVQEEADAAGITISSEFQAEMDAQGVWSAYQIDEIFCTHGYNQMTCGALETKAICTANTECVWDADDGCSLNAADLALIIADVNSAFTVSYDAACSAITVEATCTTDTTCVWSAENTGCMPTFATAKTALDAASVPAGVLAYYEVFTYGVTTCGPATVSATTCSNSTFEIWTPPASAQQGTASTCDPTAAYVLKTAGAGCGTNGATALATAQAANGISSGANTAAPAMVTISALVGALAIFA